MLAGVNASTADARSLARLLLRHPGLGADHVHVNLLPFNPWDGSPYTCVDAGVVASFRAAVAAEGVRVDVRRTRGADISGACGQLRLSNPSLS